MSSSPRDSHSSSAEVPAREPRSQPPLAHRLRQFQKRHGRIVSDDDLAALSKPLHAPLSQLRSTASFYDEFREPEFASGERLCVDLPCVITRGLPRGDDENRSSIIACPGRCDQAPVRLDRSGELYVNTTINRQIRCLVSEPWLTAPSLERETVELVKALRRESDPSLAIWNRLEKIEGLDRHRKKSGRTLRQRLRDAAESGRGSDQRFVVCHADAGNPGSTANAWLLQHRPQAILDGMAIAALAVGSAEGVICVHHEMPEVFSAVEEAIRLANESGRLKEGDLEVSVVATFGSHVGGEETSLLNAIEGLRGEARLRPPEPEVAGLFGLPTVIETAEIFALLPGWLARGHDKGIRLVTVTPPCPRPGLVEIDVSVSLRELLGEAIERETDIEAMLLGGPFGSVVFSGRQWDLPLDADVFASEGLAPGHWGITPLPVGFDVKSLVIACLDFAARESCGKCTPCRLGPLAAKEILRSGSSDENERHRFREILDTIRQTSLCGFGRDFPRPLRQLIDHYGVDRLFSDPQR